MAKRTILRFQFNGDVWPIVESWAKERDFPENLRVNNVRRYRQGIGWLVLPKIVEVKQEGAQVEIQAWVHNPLINRIVTLFLMPGERDIGKGALRMIPRSTARRDVNVLLQRLGQPPI
jgi:hypothetical protein